MTIWHAFLEFMAGIDGTEYKKTIPTPEARASSDYWRQHLRNDQGAYNDLEARRYANGKSDVSNVTKK